MRILNLQINRQFPCLLALHLVEWVVVHQLRLDGVLEVHLLLGSHHGLGVVLEEHLLQAGPIHLLDVVIKEILPLGGHTCANNVSGVQGLGQLLQLVHGTVDAGD